MSALSVRSAPSRPIGAGVCALTATLLGVVAFRSASSGWAVTALLPALLAIALWKTRPRPFEAILTDDALEITQPALERIDYRDMEVLAMPLSPLQVSSTSQRLGALVIGYSTRWLVMPPKLIPPVKEVYARLLGRVGLGGSRSPNQKLQEYLDRNRQTFGDERVFVFRVRYGDSPSLTGRIRWIGLVLLLTPLVWLIAVIAGVQMPMGAGLTVPVLILGAAFLGASFSSPLRVPRRAGDAGLVITPAGLALVQGDLSGELEWDELRGVQFGRVRGFTLAFTSQPKGLVLLVEGGSITIQNIYDRPLDAIHRIVMLNWKGAASCPLCHGTLRAGESWLCPQCEMPGG